MSRGQAGPVARDWPEPGHQRLIQFGVNGVAKLSSCLIEGPTAFPVVSNRLRLLDGRHDAHCRLARPHSRLQSNPLDGEQVEPALAEPDMVRVHQARRSDGEPARE